MGRKAIPLRPLEGEPPSGNNDASSSRKRRRSPERPESPNQDTPTRRQAEYHSPQKKMVVLECLRNLSHLLLDKEIFEAFGVPHRTGLRWKYQARIEEVEGPRQYKKRGRKQAMGHDMVERMKEALVTHPEITSWEALGKEIGAETSWRTVQRTLERDGFCSQLACTKKRLVTSELCTHTARPPIDQQMVDRLTSILATSQPDEITSWKALGCIVGCEWGWKAVQRAMVKAGYCKQISCAKRWLSHGEVCSHLLERAAEEAPEQLHEQHFEPQLAQEQPPAPAPMPT